jgi:transposase
VLQCAEGVSDRQTADTVRGRIDWKYAPALDLTDPDFDASVLSEFRIRLWAAKHVSNSTKQRLIWPG